MDDLRIHVAIHSRYQVFDASGCLPFSIVFGLCRHSSADADPRQLKLRTKASVFDVPWALANGLLEMREHSKDGDEVPLDLKDLQSDDDAQESYITLPSPVGRTANWRDAFTTFLYPIKAGSELASRLQNGKTYTVRTTSQDLGVKWWSYGEREDAEPAKLINQKSSAGKATFAIVPSIPWPPKVETRLRWLSTDDDNEILLEITVRNTSNDPVTVQTRDFQNFLIPWGPFQPDGEASDHRPRILHSSSERPPLSALQVFDLASGNVVYQIPRPASAPLTQGHDPRPRREQLVTVNPGEPLVRHVDPSTLLKNLPDGKYGLRLAPRGVWWCLGNLEDTIEDGGDRVSKKKFHTMIPPLVLESDDVVEVQVREGRATQSSSS